MHPVGHAQASKTLQVCLRLTTTGPLLHHHLSSETIVLNPTVSYSNFQLLSWPLSHRTSYYLYAQHVYGFGLQIRNPISRIATSGGGGSLSIASSWAVCVGGRLFYPILFDLRSVILYSVCQQCFLASILSEFWIARILEWKCVMAFLKSALYLHFKRIPYCRADSGSISKHSLETYHQCIVWIIPVQEFFGLCWTISDSIYLAGDWKFLEHLLTRSTTSHVQPLDDTRTRNKLKTTLIWFILLKVVALLAFSWLGYR